MANRVVSAAKAARPLPLFFCAVRGTPRLRLIVEASSVKPGNPLAHTGVAVFCTPASVTSGHFTPDAPLNLLAYISHSQRRVAHSSFVAEVYAVLEGVHTAVELSSTHAHVRTGDSTAGDFLTKTSRAGGDGGVYGLSPMVGPMGIGGSVNEYATH